VTSQLPFNQNQYSSTTSERSLHFTTQNIILEIVQTNDFLQSSAAATKAA